MSQDDKGDKEAKGGESEDIEAFLKSLEDAEVPDTATEKAGKPVATSAEDAELNARFEALGDLDLDELPAKQEPASTDEDTGDAKKKTRKERAAEKKAAKARAKQEAADAKERAKQEKSKAKEAAQAAMPAWKRVGKKGAIWALMMLPMLVFVWVVGAFLGHVISAGWLIALLALVLAVGLPLLVAKLSQRGKASWWAAGLGILLTAALVAPMPKTVGNTLNAYGHWPTSVVGEVANWEVDNPLANVGAAVSRLFGSALGAESTGALKLGSEDRLDGSVMPEAPADTTPPADTSETPSADAPADQAPSE